jgi:phage terminase large subunit
LNLELKFPKVFEEFIKAPKRYNFLKGGRGSGKSWTIAEWLLVCGLKGNNRYLCGREIQKSLKDSVHKLLSDKIYEKKYPYRVTNNQIICPLTRSEFYFSGLQDQTSQNIKSMEGIDGAWIEEAQTLTKKSLDILIPTIRKKGSFFVFSYNPEDDDDPVAELENSPDSLVITANYYDNPYCPEELIKEAQRSKEKAERTGDWSDYNHIWLGQPISRVAKIFTNYKIEDFSEIESTFDNIREGLDWGFAEDPFAWVQSHYEPRQRKLYIMKELYLYGHSNNKAFEEVQKLTANVQITADCSEPKSVYEGQGWGLAIIGAKKGQGSVEQGIRFLQSLEIIIHPRCVNTITEFRKYSYKEDRNGKVLPQPVDRYNHIIDALRYSLEQDSWGNTGAGLSFI